jgi:hypothetical protein
LPGLSISVFYFINFAEGKSPLASLELAREILNGERPFRIS